MKHVCCFAFSWQVIWVQCQSRGPPCSSACFMLCYNSSRILSLPPSFSFCLPLFPFLALTQIVNISVPEVIEFTCISLHFFLVKDERWHPALTTSPPHCFAFHNLKADRQIQAQLCSPLCSFLCFKSMVKIGIKNYSRAWRGGTSG